MNGVQYAALRAAQRGDWTLADAIEVQHRVVHDGAVCGLTSADGRLRWMVYPDGDEVLSTSDRCTDCSGTGWERTLDESGNPTGAVGLCECCDGMGECYADEDVFLDPDRTHVVTLNGETVDLENIPCVHVLTLDEANATIYGYDLDLFRAPQQGALFDLKAA